MEPARRPQAAPPPEQPDDELLSLARRIDPVVEDLVRRLVHDYREHLLAQELTYIIPAVWGARKEGPLDEVQREMHREVTQVLDQVLTLLDLDYARPAQAYAVGYLVRSLIIAKASFLLEYTKGILLRELLREGSEEVSLKDMEPLGSA
ncbi:MAG: hypothetical protein KQJ78_08010 [Deltaproteobacteria bacterium]|nr:hypothetical protein [Deltaproteobacteria bacterium]MCB2186345.1 hypothetical protein [Deltaproteobacteria bacterium]